MIINRRLPILLSLLLAVLANRGAAQQDLALMPGDSLVATVTVGSLGPGAAMTVTLESGSLYRLLLRGASGTPTLVRTGGQPGEVLELASPREGFRLFEVVVPRTGDYQLEVADQTAEVAVSFYLIKRAAREEQVSSFVFNAVAVAGILIPTRNFIESPSGDLKYSSSLLLGGRFRARQRLGRLSFLASVLYAEQAVDGSLSGGPAGFSKTNSLYISTKVGWRLTPASSAVYGAINGGIALITFGPDPVIDQLLGDVSARGALVGGVTVTLPLSDLFALDLDLEGYFYRTGNDGSFGTSSPTQFDLALTGGLAVGFN